MLACRHCGHENDETLAVCPECGLSLGDSPLRRGLARAWAWRGEVFRWRAVSVILVTFAIVYGLSVPLSVGLGKVLTRQGNHRMTYPPSIARLMPSPRLMYSGAFWNAVIAALCLGGRQLMRRPTRERLLAGACAVGAALLLVMRMGLGEFRRGVDPAPLLEVLLVWLPMFYCVIYAVRASRVPAAGSTGGHG